MSRFVKGQSNSRAQLWLQRMVKFWLASGMIAMPWTGFAETSIVRSDNTTVAGTGGVYNVYAEKQVADGIGANNFKTFNIEQNNVANMHFRTSSTSATHFDTLLNFVDGKININGTVNAIRDAKIGGHLFFLSPNGMAVGASGVINAGALSVMTPTQNWWNNKLDDSGALKGEALTAIKNNTIPINSSGTIAIQGKINVTNNLSLKAGKIYIGADADGNNKTAAVLRSGVVDFSSIVNINDLAGTGISDVNTLTATVDTDCGDIILAAEVNMKENDCFTTEGKIDNRTGTAEVNVVGGSTINAYRNADITAKATNTIEIGEYYSDSAYKYYVDGKNVTDTFDTKYRSKTDDKYTLYGSTTKVEAKINIADSGTAVTGKMVNINAVAANVYKNCSNVTGMTSTKIDALKSGEYSTNGVDTWFTDFFKDMDVVFADMTTNASVDIGAGTSITATALDKTETDVGSGTKIIPALQINALAVTEIDLGPHKQAGVTGENGQMPGVGYVWGNVWNKANVTIGGILKSTGTSATSEPKYGSTSINAAATVIAKENADTGCGDDGTNGNSEATSSAGLTYGVIAFIGDNKAEVNITNTAQMTDLYGNVSVGATANNSLSLTNRLKTAQDDKTVFAVSWADYDSDSNVNIAAPVESKFGNLTTSAASLFPKDVFTTIAQAGDKGFVSKYFRTQSGLTEEDVKKKLAGILTGASGSTNITKASDKVKSTFQTGYSGGSLSDLQKKLAVGISLAVNKQTNTAKVNIVPTGSLKAKGDLNVIAKANIDDVQIQLTGASSNLCTPTDKGKLNIANGALLLSNLENDADITIENRNRDGANAADAGGAVNLHTETKLPYNRISNMLAAINQCVTNLQHCFDNIKSSVSYSEEDKQVMQAAITDLQSKAADLQGEIYDASGNLKPEYADASDGYSKLINQMNGFTEDTAVQKFAALMQGKTYTYTDASGQQHTIKFKSTGDGSLLSDISNLMKDIMLAAGSVVGLAGAALDFTNPASYLNYYVGSSKVTGDSTVSNTTAKERSLALDLGMMSGWNKARVIVGAGAKVVGVGNVTIDADTEISDILLAGTIGNIGGVQEKFSSGYAIALADGNNVSMITMADDSLVQGADVLLKAKNYIRHVGISELLNRNTNNESQVLNSVGLFVGGNSDSIISVDDEADITATGTISLLGENTTNGIAVSGGLASGNGGTESLAYSMLNFNRNNYVTVGDNDVENLSDALIFDKEFVYEEQIISKDTEEQRLRKLIAKQSGMNADTRKKYFGSTSATNKGEISTSSLTDNALSDGYMVNVAMDVGIGPDTVERKGADSSVAACVSGITQDMINDAVGLNTNLTDLTSVLVRAIVVLAEGKATKLAAKLFSGTGSEAFNNINSHTLAMVDGTNITLTEDSTKAVLNVMAEDDGSIVAIAGGVSYSNASGGSGTSSKSKGTAFTAGAALNIVDNYTTSQISNAKIDKAAAITNEAVRKGLLVAAGAAVDVTKTDQGNVYGGGTSINIGDYGTRAILKNNTVNDSFTGYATNLTNEARNQDAQGAGCLNLNLPIGGGTSLGGVVTYDEIKNNVEASMIGGGTYKNMGNVGNIARTDLTQIQAALGMGISTGGSGSSTTLDVEGSAAVGIFANRLQANVDGITLVGGTFTSEAIDENFAVANSHIAKAAEQGLDLTGQTYIDAAETEALKDGELQDSGNTLVNVALQVGAAADQQRKNVAVGASVGVVKSDNEHVVSINKSTVTADEVNTLAKSNTLEVGVVAGGNGTNSGFAGGGSVAATLMNDRVVDEIKDSAITSDVLTLQSFDKNKLVNVTGEVAVGAGKKASAVGLDVTYNYLGTVTKTLLENSNVKEKTAGQGTDLTLLSQNDADYYSVAAGVAVSDGQVAVNGSVALNQGRNDTYAQVVSNNNNTLSLRNFNVHTEDDSYYCAGAGGLGLTYGKNSIVAVGGAVAYNQLGVKLSDEGEVITAGNVQQNIAKVEGYNINKLTGVIDVGAKDEAKMLTVAVGVGLSRGKVAVQGASADTFLYKDTEAGMYDTNVNKDGTAQGKVNVHAVTNNDTKSVAVVVAGTTGAVAVGAGVNVVTMQGDTAAILAGGTYKVADVLVKAKSYQKLLSNVIGVAASETVGVGGSVTISNLTNNTYSVMGYDDSSKLTYVNANGSVGVVAESNEDFENYAGDATFAVGTGKVKIGAGASVTVNQSGGNTIATVQNADINTRAETDNHVTLRNSITGQNESYKGLVVDADAYHKFYDAPWSGGLSVSTTGVAIGVNAVVSADDMEGSTKAQVKSVTFNKDKKDSIATGNDFVVQATDRANVTPVITNAVVDVALSSTIGIGIGLGAGVGDFDNNRVVEATVYGDDNRKVINADKLRVDAESKIDFEAVNTAVSISISTGETTSVGLSSATGVTSVNLESVTKAVVKGIESTNNGISLTANSDVQFKLVDTSVVVAISAAMYGISLGAGVHVDTIKNDSKTIALLEDSSIYHYTDNTADDVISSRGNYNAHNQDCNVSVDLSLLSAGAGVLVMNNELNNVVTADVKNSTIGTKDSGGSVTMGHQARDIDVFSQNRVTTDFDNQNVDVAIISVGVGSGLSTVDSSVASNVTGSTLYARHDIDVQASQDITMKGEMVAVPVGAISVGVSTLHNYVGTAVVDDQYESWEDGNVSKEKLASSDYSSRNIDDLVVFGTKGANGILENIEKEYASYAKFSSISFDNMTKTVRSATVNSEGTKVNLTNAQLYAGNDINVLTKETVNSTPKITAAGVGILEVGVSNNRVRVAENTGMNVTGSYFKAGNNINMTPISDGTLEALTTQVGVGALDVGVTIGEVTKSGNMSIVLNTANMVAGESINIKSADTMKLLNKGNADQVGVLSAVAVDYKASDSTKNTITLEYDKDAQKGNTLDAKSISVQAGSLPGVTSQFHVVTVSVLSGCGVVMESKAANQALLTVDDFNTFLGDTVKLESGIYAKDAEYSVNTDVHSVGVTASLGICVNKAKTYTDFVVQTDVGAIGLKELTAEEDYGTSLAVNAFESTNIRDYVTAVSVGVAASGTNQALIDLKSNVTTNVDVGTTGIYAKDLHISSSSKDYLYGYSNGDGGGVLDVSPNATYVELMVEGNTTTNVTGDYSVLNNAVIDAVRTDEFILRATALQAEVAGGSGTVMHINKVHEKTAVNLNEANIASAGKVNVEAHNNIYVNNDNSRGVEGNGYGGVDIAVAELKNKDMQLDATVNIDSSKILAGGDIVIDVGTDGHVVLDTYVYAVGLLSADPCAETNSSITLNNMVNVKDSKNKGTKISTKKSGKNLTLAAAENIDVYVRAYTEAAFGLVGVVVPQAYSTFVRSNNVNVEKGTLFSCGDIRLYGGKDANGNEANMNLNIESEAFNNNVSGVIPCKCFVDNNLQQNNSVYIGENANVTSIRHTELYADNGFEGIVKIAEYHSGWGYTYDQGNKYVSTSAGNVESEVVRDNYVEVNGNVIAGLANLLTIDIGTTAGEYVIVAEQERKLVSEYYNDVNLSAEQKRVIYSGSDADKAKYISFGDPNTEEGRASIAAAEIMGLTLDNFIVGAASYSQMVGDRLNEINALLADYGRDTSDTDTTVKAGLEAEKQRLQQILASMGGNDGSGTGTKIPDMVDYIIVPELAASGGNVTVNTRNFKGNGKVEAKGSPELKITNYTNLMMITNAITMDESGGIIEYNNTKLQQPSESMPQQVQAINEADSAVNLKLVASGNPEQDPAIYICGMYDGQNINFAEGTYYLTDGNGNPLVYDSSKPLKDDEGNDVAHKIHNDVDQYYQVISAGSFKPKADIRVAGNISSRNGLAYVESKNNSVTIAGLSAKDDVSVTAKKVSIIALKGDVTQGYTAGTVSIGGEVSAQYSAIYNAFINRSDVKDKTGKVVDNSSSLIITELVNGSKASDNMPPDGYWIAGGQVYIAANDININGVIQSGYDEYIANITAEDQSRIDSIIANWTNAGKKELTDTVVKNSGSTYLVDGGDAVWNSGRQCYEYGLAVYFNPSTKRLLTENVDEAGGKIYLTGRIASTGGGKVICLDGTYNIKVDNELNYDLSLGQLSVNDTKGLISITDMGYNYVTEITSKGVVVKDYKTKAVISSDHISQVDSRNYTYKPKTGLRYDWVTGYNNTTYKKYTTTEMACWWGWADYEPVSETDLYSWVTSGNCTQIGTGDGEKLDRSDGAYLSEKNIAADVYLMHTGDLSKTYIHEVEPVREYSSGFFGCHKYREYTYMEEDASIYTDYASVKADNTVAITLIGVAAEDSSVKVNTTQNLYVGQRIGNSELYEIKQDETITGRIEKGTVELTSCNGSVIQEGGGIYGAAIQLSAKNDLQNINVIAGDEVNLTGTLTGTGTANIMVDEAYGGTEGNVILHNLGGTNAAIVDLSVTGSIIQNSTDDLVQAKKINLTSGGSVGGRNEGTLYLIGGQDADADSQDTLRASVNIDARNDVNITQKTGNLRIGTICSIDGNVNITVPDGSIRDALPYVEDDNIRTEAELLAKWESLGLTTDASGNRTAAQDAKNAYLAEGVKADKNYEDSIKSQYDDYVKLKQKIAEGKTLFETEKKLYDIYEPKYRDYDSAQAYINAEVSDPNSALSQLKENADIIKNEVGTTYRGWDKNQLLYALQDAVINHHAGVKSSNKAPNIYAKNVDLTVKNDVGLNSPEVTVIDLDGEITKENLQKLARADAATVEWYIDKNTGHKMVTVQEKLAIGLHQKDGSCKINVTTTDPDVENTKNVFLEVRKDENLDNNLNLVIGSITIANGDGDVRISSLKDILTSDDGYVLSARNVVLQAGEEGTNDGNIGSEADYFDLNMTGALTATATGNIYLTQSSKDWYINSMSVGVVDEEHSTTSGNIYLKSAGNIYGIYNPITNVQGYIQTDNSGIISVDAGANIGDWNDSTKILRVKNNAGEVILNAAKDIVLEGVSTEVGSGNAPAGTLVVTEAKSGTAKVKLIVNGGVELGHKEHEFGTIYLDSALDTIVKGSVIDDLNITNTNSNNVYTATVDGQVLQLNNVTKGLIDVFVYGDTRSGKSGLKVNSDLRATGDIILNIVGNIGIAGDIISPVADVNVAADKDVYINGDIDGSNGLVAIATENGERVNVNGRVKGNKVIFYTENVDTEMHFCLDSTKYAEEKDKHNIIFGDELILACNNWFNDNNDGIRREKNTFDTGMLHSDKDIYNIRIYSAGGTQDEVNYNLDFRDMTKQLHIGTAVVNNLIIKTEGRVTIDDLSTTNRVDIYTMGTKTSVYGRPLDYDSEAATVYYAPGKGAGAAIWFHDMFFDGTSDSYRDVMEKYKTAGVAAFEVGGNIGGLDGHGQGMYLDIRSATDQTGTGLIQKAYYGQKVYPQRYSLEQLAQHLLNMSTKDRHNQSFNNAIELFPKANLVEIPDVVVNQPVDLKGGSFEIEGMSTNAKGEKVKKLVKYEF